VLLLSLVRLALALMFYCHFVLAGYEQINWLIDWNGEPYQRNPKRHILARVCVVWAIMRDNSSTRLTCRLVPIIDVVWDGYLRDFLKRRMSDCIKSFTKVQGDDYYIRISWQEISNVVKKVALYESSGSGASWPEYPNWSAKVRLWGGLRNAG